MGRVKVCIALDKSHFVSAENLSFREGEALRQFQDFREKFWSKFRISLYILYIFTSPSAQDREKSASLGRLFPPNCPLG